MRLIAQSHRHLRDTGVTTLATIGADGRRQRVGPQYGSDLRPDDQPGGCQVIVRTTPHRADAVEARG